jgi:hypothetical protein
MACHTYQVSCHRFRNSSKVVSLRNLRGSRERCLKYAVEIGSGSMIYIPSFIKTGSGIQKLLCREN